jgi:hypothetical protein
MIIRFFAVIILMLVSLWIVGWILAHLAIVLVVVVIAGAIGVRQRNGHG